MKNMISHAYEKANAVSERSDAVMCCDLHLLLAAVSVSKCDPQAGCLPAGRLPVDNGKLFICAANCTYASGSLYKDGDTAPCCLTKIFTNIGR